MCSELRIENVDGLSDAEKFKMLSDDTDNEFVVLHYHGGGFMYCLLERKLTGRFCDPKSHRGLLTKMSRDAKCRVLSLR